MGKPIKITMLSLFLPLVFALVWRLRKLFIFNFLLNKISLKGFSMRLPFCYFQYVNRIKQFNMRIKNLIFLTSGTALSVHTKFKPILTVFFSENFRGSGRC